MAKIISNDIGSGQNYTPVKPRIKLRIYPLMTNDVMPNLFLSRHAELVSASAVKKQTLK
jgi:hypothetical protein